MRPAWAALSFAILPGGALAQPQAAPAAASATPLLVPAFGAAAAFALNQGAAHWARLRGRWNVAINVHREATEACVALPGFHANFLAAVPERLRAREKLFFLDDGSEGGVFKAFGAEIKTLPPSVAAASLLFFERYAFLSHMLLKLEGGAAGGLSVARQIRLADDVAEAIADTIGAAHRTRVLCRLYLRGRYVPFLRTGPAARLALGTRRHVRALRRWWREADRRTVQPGLKLPAKPWRPELGGGA